MAWFFAGFFTVIALAYINHFVSVWVMEEIDLNYGTLLEFYPERLEKIKATNDDPSLLRWKKLIGIIKHKIAYLYVQLKYDHKITWRAICHDCDKMLLIIFCWNLSVSHIGLYHRVRSKHHTKSKTPEDRYYQIIDWESARYTKKDKPYTAYEYVNLMYNNHEIEDNLRDEYLSIIDRLKLPKQHLYASGKK